MRARSRVRKKQTSESPTAVALPSILQTLTWWLDLTFIDERRRFREGLPGFHIES